MTKIVNAHNEWDPLKRLILGRPEGTQVAAPEPGLNSHQPEGGFPIGTFGPYPQEMVDEANEQMDDFVSVLKNAVSLLTGWMSIRHTRRFGQCDPGLDLSKRARHQLPP